MPLPASTLGAEARYSPGTRLQSRLLLGTADGLLSFLLFHCEGCLGFGARHLDPNQPWPIRRSVMCAAAARRFWNTSANVAHVEFHSQVGIFHSKMMLCNAINNSSVAEGSDRSWLQSCAVASAACQVRWSCTGLSSLRAGRRRGRRRSECRGQVAAIVGNFLTQWLHS